MDAISWSASPNNRDQRGPKQMTRCPITVATLLASSAVHTTHSSLSAAAVSLSKHAAPFSSHIKITSASSRTACGLETSASSLPYLPETYLNHREHHLHLHLSSSFLVERSSTIIIPHGVASRTPSNPHHFFGSSQTQTQTRPLRRTSAPPNKLTAYRFD